MKENQLTIDELKALIENSYNKLEKTEEIDSKIFGEKSNTLNWILTLTTLFLGIGLQNYNSITSLYLKDELFLIEKIIFALSLIMLVAYKLVNNNYEKHKKSFLMNLHTHKLELLFDIKTKLRLSDELTLIPSFINRFRNGEFIPAYDTERKNSLMRIDQKVKISGKWLKLIYGGIMIVFVINLIITIILIMNINGG